MLSEFKTLFSLETTHQEVTLFIHHTHHLSIVVKSFLKKRSKKMRTNRAFSIPHSAYITSNHVAEVLIL